MTSILFVLFTVLMTPMVMAEENNTDELDDVNVAVGESLSVAIDSSSVDLESEIDSRAFDARMNNANSDAERVEIALNRLQRVEEDISNLENSGDSNQGSPASHIARNANKADKLNSQLNDIEYVLSNVNESESSESLDKIDDLRSDLSVSGSESAGVVRDGILSNNLQVRMNASEDGLRVAADASGERVYNGLDRKSEAHRQFNITEDEAIDIALSNVDNDSVELSSVKEQKRGAYEVEFVKEGSVKTVVVDSRDGEIQRISDRRNISEQAKENIPKFILGEDGKIGQGPPQDIGERGQPSWAGNNDRPEQSDRDETSDDGGDDNTDRPEQSDDQRTQPTR